MLVLIVIAWLLVGHFFWMVGLYAIQSNTRHFKLVSLIAALLMCLIVGPAFIVISEFAMTRRRHRYEREDYEMLRELDRDYIRENQ
jgi:hypothetical protein